MKRLFITTLLVIAPFAAGEDQGVIRGVTLDPAGEPLTEVRVAICNMNENTPQMTLSGNDGKFLMTGLKPGKYQITAEADGYETELPVIVEVTDQQAPEYYCASREGRSERCEEAVGIFLASGKSLLRRLASRTGRRAAKHRGYDPPESNPPYPFAVWPIGGTPWIGYNNATSYPLTTALQNGPNGDWWKKWNIQIYGWANAGFNFSTSTQSVGGKYANAPMGYNQIPELIPARSVGSLY